MSHAAKQATGMEAEPAAGRAARGTVQILVANVVVLISGFGVSVILARGLGPAAFGVYGVIMSVVVWLERIIGAGIPGATATLILRSPDQEAAIARSARLLIGVLALVLFGAVWVSAPALSAVLGIPSGTSLIRIAAFNLPAMAMYFAYEGIFNGLRLFAAQSALQIAQSVAKLVGILLLLLVGLSIAGAFVAHVAATAAAIVVARFVFRRRGGSASVALISELIRVGLPMGAYALALSVLLNLSLWQLQHAVNQSAIDVGHYVAGVNLTRIMMMIPATVSGVLFASLVWARTTSQPQLVTKYVQEAVRFAMVVTVPACVLLGMDADAVMGLLFGPEYVAGGRILAVLCVGFALVALVDVLFHALMAHGRLLLSAGILAGLVPVLYALNASWIPGGGGAGAAVAFVATMGIGATTAVLIVLVQLGSPVRLRMLFRVGTSGLAVGVLSWLLPASGILLMVKLGGLSLVYLFLLWVTGEVSSHDLKPFALWKR